MNAIVAAIDPATIQPMVNAAVVAAVSKARDEIRIAEWCPALTEEQAAKLLTITPRSLAELRRAGKIGYVRIVCGKIRYRPEDIETYLARGAVPPRDTGNTAA